MQINFQVSPSSFFELAFLNTATGGFDLEISATSSEQLQLTNPATGYVTTFTGSGLAVDGSGTVSGNVSGIVTRTPEGTAVATFWQVGLPLPDLLDAFQQVVVEGSSTLLDGLLSRAPLGVTNDADEAGLAYDFSAITSAVRFSTNTDGVTVEGGSGNDRLDAFPYSASAATIIASPGNDTIDLTLRTSRADNRFVLDYSKLDAPITATEGASWTYLVVAKEGAGTDTLLNFFNHAFLAAAPVLIGTSGDDRLTLELTQNDDLTLALGAGNDTLDVTLSGYERSPSTLRLDYSQGTQGVVADLAAGQVAEDGFGGTDTLSLAYGTSAFGSVVLMTGAQDDSLSGSALDDVFLSGAGQDTLAGGGGHDVLRYDTAATAGGISADLGAATVSGLWDGAEFLHHFSDIDEILGSDGDDTILGGAAADVVRTGAGDDYISTGDAPVGTEDVIDPGTGYDTIDAGGLSGGGLRIEHQNLPANAEFYVTIDGHADSGMIYRFTGLGTATIENVTAAMDAGGLTLVGTDGADRFDVTVSDGGTLRLIAEGRNDQYNFGASEGTVVLDYSESTVTSVALASSKFTGLGAVNLEVISSRDYGSGVYGSQYDETIIAVSLSGYYNGGEGIDTLRFDSAYEAGGVTLDLENYTASGQVLSNANGSPASFTHYVTGFEIAYGTAQFDDTLIGTTAGEEFHGLGGDDVIYGDGFDAAYTPEAGAAVYRFYQATLDRLPDEAGHDSWTEALVTGSQRLLEIAHSFVESFEFKLAYGALENDDFVTQLYQNVMGRAPDAAGLAYWLEQIEEAGMSRAQVVMGFSQSAELRAATAAEADAYARSHTQAAWSDDVFRLYQATLDRAPDLGGLTDWSDRLATGTALTAVIDGFVQSEEFQAIYGDLDDAGFVTQLYRNVLDRDPDAEGLADWLDRLEAGASRAQVVKGFSQSTEFIAASQDETKDWMRAQEGAGDLLSGGAGNDRLAGGIFADTFVFRAGETGENHVLDLEAWDYIRFEGFGYDSVEDIRAHVSETGQDVVFSDQGVTVVFEHSRQAGISDDMLIWA